MKLQKTVLAGLLGALALASAASAAFIPVNGNIATNTRWSRDNVYILTRIIFVEPGVTLTIEPGTIIRGVPAGVSGSDISTEPGTLVATRGSKIVANGTPDDPIVLTSIDDPNVIGGTATIPGFDGTSYSFVNSLGNTKTAAVRNYAPGGPTGTNGFAYNAQLGGLIILGNAYVANYNVGTPPTADTNADGLPDEPFTPITGTNVNVGGYGRDFIEGLSPQVLADAGDRGTYGNKTDNDNSGVFRFFSSRYGGFKIGTNNEINSITLGGVGSGTVVEFCEAALNLDDGFEFFGGNVNTRHLFSIYNLDDSFDADEGFRGTHQFWSVLQGNLNTARSGYGNDSTIGVTATDAFYDNIFEVDGAETNDNAALPYTNFSIYNLSVVSGGLVGQQFSIIQDARVFINNAVGSRLADIAQVTQTALNPIGTIADVSNFHYFFDANAATTENRTFTDLVAPVSTAAIEELSSQIGADGIFTKNGYDPRVTGAAALAEDGPLPPAGLVQVNYAGYQRNNTFLSGWSILDYLEVIPATNVARPAVTLSGTTNPIISFPSAGATVKYVIEKSTDRRSWTPVNSGNTFSNAGTITHTDTTTTLTSGTPVFYRAYAL